MPKVFSVLCAIFISLMSAFVIKKENEYLSKLFFIIAGILFSEFLFIGACIQIISLPGRARFQYTLCNIVLITVIMDFCFHTFKDNAKIKKVACTSCCALSILFCIFVSAECFRMSKKWDAMEQDIQAQKNAGKTDIVIDKNTFSSKYRNYSDWGNPGGDPDVWPNTTYAKFYGVNSIIAK